MLGFIVLLLIVAYFVMAVITSKRHYHAKHGIDIRSSTVGRIGSYSVGWVWPLMFVQTDLLKPQLCDHLRHVELRAAARDRVRNYQQALATEEELRGRGRNR